MTRPSHRRVYRNPRTVRRLERMLAALGNPPTRDVDVSDTEGVIDAVDMKSFPAHLAKTATVFRSADAVRFSWRTSRARGTHVARLQPQWRHWKARIR